MGEGIWGNSKKGGRGLGLCAMYPPVALVSTAPAPLFVRVRPVQRGNARSTSRALVGLHTQAFFRSPVRLFRNATRELIIENERM